MDENSKMAYRSATRYRCPSFSNSAITQSVTQGMPAGNVKERRRQSMHTLTFGVEAVHHPADQLQLVLQAEINEVGINKNTVWRYKSIVVLQKER